MTKEEKLFNLLEKRYKHLIELLDETDEQQEAKKRLYKKNNQAIEKSLAHSLTLHQSNKETLDKHFIKLKERIRKILNEKLKTVDEEKTYEDQVYDKLLKSLTDSFDNKIALNKLKREKVKATYNHAVKTATETSVKTENDAEAKIDKAVRTHNAHMERLLSETNELYESNDKIESEAKTTFDKTVKKIERDKQSALTKIKKHQSDYTQSFKEALASLKESYKTEKKPLEKEIKALIKDYEKEIKTLEDAHQKELTKLTNYKNEAVKIGDSNKAHEYEKQIKQLKKTHQATLKEKKNEHENTMSPEEEKLAIFEKDYEDKFKDLKYTAIDQIIGFLSEIETANTDAQKKIEEANTEYNLALNEHKSKKDAINIDYEIQSINFNQTLQENKTMAEHDKNLSKPKRDLEENEARFQRDMELNELEKADRVAEEKNKKDKSLADENHTLEENKLSLAHKRLNYLYDYDVEQLKIEKNRQLIKRDETEETMLMSHYMKQSENYTALRSETIEAKKSYVEALANQQKQDLDELYEKLLKDAKSDHEAMIKKIETAYQKEKDIYQNPLNELKKSHEKTINDMISAHAKEREQLSERLDNSNDKKRKETLRKELRELGENHDEILNQKKKALKKKEAGFETMLADLKSYKNRSLEEAETLLYHITDQISLAQEENAIAAENLTTNFDARHYEIKHRAKLFRTFQRQRQHETIEKTHQHQNERLHRLNAKQNKSQTILEEQLKAVQQQYEQEYETIRSAIQKAELSYDKTLTEIEKIKEENNRNLNESYEVEKERLEGYMYKLNRNHDQAIKKIKDDAKQNKDACFEHKKQGEEAKSREENRLKNALEVELDTKDANKNQTIENYKNRGKALKSHIDADIHKRLNEKTITRVDDVLKAEKDYDII